MKRAHEPGESQEDQLENEKRARENDEARKQGKTYVEHGGKHDGSMKSSLFQHVMDVTEDMFKIPEVYGFKKKIRNQKYRLSNEIWNLKWKIHMDSWEFNSFQTQN